MTNRRRRVTMHGHTVHTRTRLSSSRSKSDGFRPNAGVGWGAALLEIEHQAEHWDNPAHGEIGHLIAEALRTAVAIARTGGLRCDHRLETQLDATPENQTFSPGKRSQTAKRELAAALPSADAS
jgi:hypothetical protein